MYRKKKNQKLLIITILVLIISIGFAYLTTTLEIQTIAGVRGNTWKIYFDNVEIYQGEDLATKLPTTSSTDTLDLEFSATLKEPGDKFKFFVDVVNAGSLNAMLNIVKVNDLTTEQKEYLNYTITYADETPLSRMDLLAKKTTDTLAITIEFKKDIIEENIPETDITITPKIHLDYRQANTKAVARTTSKPLISYDWNFNFIKNGDFNDGLNHWDILNNAQISIDRNITYNGKASMHVLTSTDNWSGVGNDYQSYEKEVYPFEHNYRFHGCFYKDSTSQGGGVNQAIRMYIGFYDSEGNQSHIGIGNNTDMGRIMKNLKEKEWVCFDEDEYLSDNNYPDKTNKSFRVDNFNQQLVNNYWMADLSLKIVDKEEYEYNTTITELPTPEREGYTFAGWYTDQYGGTKIEVGQVVRESVTYYAHWS